MRPDYSQSVRGIVDKLGVCDQCLKEELYCGLSP